MQASLKHKHILIDLIHYYCFLIIAALECPEKKKFYI